MNKTLLTELRFNLYAWRKMCFIRDLGSTEVSFFAVSRRDNPGLVVDVRMPYQTGFGAYTEFNEDRLADFFEDMVDEGYHPAEFGRIWCHTHPGTSANPSSKDEDTFTKEFAAPTWAIMFILGKGEKADTTCRIKYQNHPELANVIGSHSEKNIEVVLDLEANTPGINDEVRATWKAEYEQRLTKGTYNSGSYLYPGGYNWNNHTHDCYPPTTPYKSWRQQASEKVFGPGWRKNSHGKWFYTAKQAEYDKACNITVSPDFTNSDNTQKAGTSSSPTSEDWRQRFQSDEQKTPLGFYRPETTHSGRLTRREKKYLKKHGTLEGFVPPQQKMVPTQRLETSRNLLYEQNDDTFLDEALSEYSLDEDPLSIYDSITTGYTRYDVTLDDGSKYEGVWARCSEEAVDMVMLALGGEISWYDGTCEEIPEPTDAELKAIEQEEELQPSLDTGLASYSAHELAAKADDFHDSLFAT